MSKEIRSVFEFDIQYRPGVAVSWKFDFDNLDEIHYINSGCYCTVLQELGTNYISGVLNIDHAMSSELREKEGAHEVEKTVAVYLDDSVPEFIKGELSRRTYNPLKRIINLTIRGIVRVG